MNTLHEEFASKNSLKKTLFKKIFLISKDLESLKTEELNKETEIDSIIEELDGLMEILLKN